MSVDLTYSAPVPTLSGPGAGRRERSRSRGWIWYLLMAPAVLLIAIFFVWPVFLMAVESFLGPDLTLENYRTFFGSPIYTQVLGRTFGVAALVTVLCLALGYPYAYLMTITSGWKRTMLLGIILIPFWTSLLVRSIAWVFLLQDTGAINSLLIGTGVIQEPISMIRTMFGVSLGMTQVLLPFMVLPLFGTLLTIDSSLQKASASLGARPSVGFWRVYFPLSLPGVIAGSLLVFVLALGFYITPALLGGPQDMMLGQLIVQQISQVLNWGMGSAIAMVLLVSALGLIGLVGLLLNRHSRRADAG